MLHKALINISLFFRVRVENGVFEFYEKKRGIAE